MKKNNSNKKFKIIIIILCVLILITGGTLTYFIIENMKAEQLAKEKAEQEAVFEQKLNEAISEAVELCPKVLKFVGEDEKNFNFFVENINSSNDIYEKATNANSLIKTAAFYIDQYMAVDIEAIEQGKDVNVIYTSQTTQYKDELMTLRNKFSENWYGFLGKSDLNILGQENMQEAESVQEVESVEER